MSDELLPVFRTAITDALGRPIPDEGPLRVWLDDDVEDRAAPAGWTHVITAREACLLLATGRVAELSLDHDIGALEDGGDDPRIGNGHQVVDFLDEQAGVHGRRPARRDGASAVERSAAARHRG